MASSGLKELKDTGKYSINCVKILVIIWRQVCVFSKYVDQNLLIDSRWFLN